MKKLVATIASALVSLTMAAQSSVVYYTPVNKTMEVGLGFDRQSHKCVLSIIEEAKSDVDFSFDILNNEGESILNLNDEEGKVNVLPKTKKVNYYECNYELSMNELRQLMNTAKNSETIMINGQEFDSAELASTIQDIQKEWMKPAVPANGMKMMPPMGRPMEFKG